MCLPDRNTDRRGRPPAFLRSWKRKRARRRSCKPLLSAILLLLAFLAPDRLGVVLHTLALVGLGRTVPADFRRHLADQPLVNTLDPDRRRLVADDLDALRHREQHVGREPEVSDRA